jgi:hypothetical protein
MAHALSPWILAGNSHARAATSWLRSFFCLEWTFIYTVFIDYFSNWFPDLLVEVDYSKNLTKNTFLNAAFWWEIGNRSDSWWDLIEILEIWSLWCETSFIWSLIKWLPSWNLIVLMRDFLDGSNPGISSRKLQSKFPGFCMLFRQERNIYTIWSILLFVLPNCAAQLLTHHEQIIFVLIKPLG